MITELEKFKEWLNVNGYAGSTIKIYLQRIQHFLENIAGRITQESIEQYLLANFPVKKNKTINCHRDAISTYLKYKGLGISFPKRLKEEIKIPDSIPLEKFEEEILPMAECTFRSSDRTVAILSLMFFSGLRRSEICRLERKYIDIENLKGRVYRPKTRDWHIFYFDETTRDRLYAYFISSEEEKNALNVKIGGINYIFRRLKKDFQEIKLRPHLFRSSRATALLKEGVNLKYIQEILGHRSLKSTERYLSVEDEDVQKAYQGCVEKQRDKMKKRKRNSIYKIIK